MTNEIYYFFINVSSCAEKHIKESKKSFRIKEIKIIYNFKK
jgi:hypothetical protein